jgi:hypothetical protein
MTTLAIVTTKKICRQPSTSSSAVASGVATRVPTLETLLFSAITAPRFFGK